MLNITGIEQLFDERVLKILKVAILEEDNELYLLEISKKSGVAPASAYRIVNKLVKLGFLNLRVISKFKLYSIAKSKETALLKTILNPERKALDVFIDKMKELLELKEIILHGEESKEMANVLLIGDNIDPSFVKSVVYDIKTQLKFSITPLSLTLEQYEQMANMGLYAGEKKVIFMREDNINK